MRDIVLRLKENLNTPYRQGWLFGLFNKTSSAKQTLECSCGPETYVPGCRWCDLECRRFDIQEWRLGFAEGARFRGKENVFFLDNMELEFE